MNSIKIASAALATVASVFVGTIASAADVMIRQSDVNIQSTSDYQGQSTGTSETIRGIQQDGTGNLVEVEKSTFQGSETFSGNSATQVTETSVEKSASGQTAGIDASGNPMATDGSINMPVPTPTPVNQVPMQPLGELLQQIRQ